MNLKDLPPSKNFEDRTGRRVPEMEQDIRFKYELSPDEEFMMKENGWSFEDIFILRKLKEKIINGDGYGPDKNFFNGRR